MCIYILFFGSREIRIVISFLNILEIVRCILTQECQSPNLELHNNFFWQDHLSYTSSLPGHMNSHGFAMTCYGFDMILHGFCMNCYGFDIILIVVVWFYVICI